MSAENSPRVRRTQPGTARTFGGRHAGGGGEGLSDLALRERRVGGRVQNPVPQLGLLRGRDHCRGQIGNVGEGMRLVRASHHLQRAAGEDGGHHALAGVCHPDAGAEEIARHHGRRCPWRSPSAPAAAPRGSRVCRPPPPRAVFGHHPLRIAVGVKAFGKNDDGARLACRRQDRLFGGRKLLFPGRGAVGRAVDAVEDRRRALESVSQQAGVGDIHLQLLDVRMVGPAAGAGENPDPLAPLRQLLCHRPAHGPAPVTT